jgi:hypothetical protein
LNQNKVHLKLDWCTHQAAKYACEHWHYSKTMPVHPIVAIGVWEDTKYIGCVLFYRGASSNLLNPYGLKNIEGCELTRVALDKHLCPVSRIVAIAIKMLHKKDKGLRIIVSFADANHGHAGGIYQAGNWIFCGDSSNSKSFIDKAGKRWHTRQVSVTGHRIQYGKSRPVPKPSDCAVIMEIGKHRYLMPLDDAMRKQIEPLRKPYPKKCVSNIEIDVSGLQPGKGGVIPTDTLHFNTIQNYV